MTNWVRLWEDMPSDPKWRAVSRRSGRPVSEVIAVFVHMMCNASDWKHWGFIENWNDEDVAAALDMEPGDVLAIRTSMQDKTLDGNYLTGWDKRQNKNADSSAIRMAAWRGRKREALGVTSRPVTSDVGGDKSDVGRDADREREEDIDSTSLNPSTPTPYQDSQNEHLSVPPKRTRKKLAYPEQFEEFWSAYPTDANMSKSEALQQWQKLDDADREAAVGSLTSFKAYCRSNKDYRPVHACRYLKSRRFDGHLATARKIAAKARIFVRLDTPQWEAWADFYQRTKGTSPPSNGKGGWYFPSEFPEERHA